MSKFNAELKKIERVNRLAEIESELNQITIDINSLRDANRRITDWDKYHTLITRETNLKSEAYDLNILTKDKFYISEYLYSDVHAYEVVGEKSDKCLLIRRLDVTEEPEARKKRLASFVPGGFCGHFDNDLQKWIYTSNESNPIVEVRLHKNGAYYLAGGSSPFHLRETPYEHYDYNF